MKLQISTAKLCEMLSRAIKGVGNNKLIPLTSLIGIRLESGKLTLTTTDASNYLYITHDGIDGEDFYVTVQADILYKLVSKITSPDVTLDVTESSLDVIGNGHYKIDIPFDEEGEPIKYPDPVSEMGFSKKIGAITKEQITRVLNSVKPAIMTNGKMQCYMNYYVSDSVIATDTFKVACLSNCNILEDAKLISLATMNLLDVASTGLDVFAVDNKVLYTSDDVVIYSVELNGVDEFNAEAISNLVKQEFPCKCSVNKEKLLQAIDRVSLFLGSFDNGQIELRFTNEGICVNSIGGRGTETIKYSECANTREFVCTASVLDLVPQIKAQSSELITINYGEDNAIQIIDGDLVSIVALLQE